MSHARKRIRRGRRLGPGRGLRVSRLRLQDAPPERNALPAAALPEVRRLDGKGRDRSGIYSNG